jgi:hypothetical protein
MCSRRISGPVHCRRVMWLARNALQATQLLKGDGVAWPEPPANLQGQRRDLHTPNDCLCVVKNHIPHEVTLFAPNTVDLKEYNLEKKSANPRCVQPCLWDEWQWVNLP